MLWQRLLQIGQTLSHKPRKRCCMWIFPQHVCYWWCKLSLYFQQPCKFVQSAKHPSQSTFLPSFSIFSLMSVFFFIDAFSLLILYFLFVCVPLLCLHLIISHLHFLFCLHFVLSVCALVCCCYCCCCCVCTTGSLYLGLYFWNLTLQAKPIGLPCKKALYTSAKNGTVSHLFTNSFSQAKHSEFLCCWGKEVLNGLICIQFCFHDTFRIHYTKAKVFNTKLSKI